MAETAQTTSHLRGLFPLGVQRWPRISLWISLVVSCFGMAVTSSYFTASIWQNAMRDILHLTLTDIMIMIQVGGTGVALCAAAGKMYEKVGSQLTALLGGAVSVASYLMLWLATSTWSDYFAAHLWLLVVAWFLAVSGCQFTYMAALMTNVHNFPSHQRGTIIGVLDGSRSLAPAIFSAVYNTAFTNGYLTPGQEGSQNLSGFFLLLAITYGIVTLAMIVFVGRLKEELNSDIAPLIQNDEIRVDVNVTEPQLDINAVAIFQEEKPPSSFSEVPFKESRLRNLLCTPNFYFFLLQLVLSASAQTAYTANIPAYLGSFEMNQFNLLFNTLNPILAAGSKVAAGFISDKIAQRTSLPRSVVFLIPYGLQTVFFVVSIFWGDRFSILLATNVIASVANGATWCVSPAILGELYGSKFLASNWGLSSMLIGATGVPISFGFSLIYQAAIYQPGEIYCYGLQCYTWSFVLFAGISFCSFLMALALVESMLRNASHRRLLMSDTHNSSQ